jgi:hypothetical protein
LKKIGLSKWVEIHHDYIKGLPSLCSGNPGVGGANTKKSLFTSQTLLLCFTRPAASKLALSV